MNHKTNTCPLHLFEYVYDFKGTGQLESHTIQVAKYRQKKPKVHSYKPSVLFSKWVFFVKISFYHGNMCG